MCHLRALQEVRVHRPDVQRPVAMLLLLLLLPFTAVLYEQATAHGVGDLL
jgi:hypothetical protein